MAKGFAGMRATLLGAVVAIVSSCGTSNRHGVGARGPLTRVVGPAFYTGNPEEPWVRTVVVDSSGTVVALETESVDASSVSAGETRWTLPGTVATPGLVDAHVHLHWLGQTDETADLRGAADADEVASRLQAIAALYPTLAVVRGYGWDDGLNFIDLTAALRVVPHPRPIVLTRVDGHALWLNGPALAILAARGLLSDGIEGSGQRVARDADGQPTGLVSDPALAVWNALADPPDEGQVLARFDRALRRLGAGGLVAVHDMATRPGHLSAIVKAQAAIGPSAPRVVVYLEDTDASWTWLETHAPGPVEVTPSLEVRGVKLFADGALGSRGAALREPYSDAPGESGAVLDQAILDDRVARAIELGYDVAIHAIGDRAVEASLNAFEAGQGVVGPHPAHAYRHRIEHAQIATPADRARFVALGVIASMQPTHGVSDSPWACARLGPKRGEHAYAIKDFRAEGVALALGSDAPIETWRPLTTLRSAVLTGDQPGGCAWLHRQKLGVADAIDGMTRGAAYAAGQEARWGRILIGRPLELTLFDVNVFEGPEAVKGARILGRVAPRLPRQVLPVEDVGAD